MKETADIVVTAIDDLVVLLVGALSLGYCIFTRNFAEINIKLNFLPFPAFIGEIILLICASLFLIKWIVARQKIMPWHSVALVYFTFVLAKALFGYFKWGALAFRNAALFYYPAFAIFGYFFFRRIFFSTRKNVILALALFAVLSVSSFYAYYTLTCFILIIILINSFRIKAIKYIVILPLLLFGYYKLFLENGRALLVGNILAVFFIIVALFFILKTKKVYKNIIALSLFIMLSLSILILTDSNSLKTLTNFKAKINLYRAWNRIILVRKDIYKMKKINKIKLYNKETSTIRSFTKSGGADLYSLEEVQLDNKESPIMESAAKNGGVGISSSEKVQLNNKEGSTIESVNRSGPGPFLVDDREVLITNADIRAAMNNYVNVKADLNDLGTIEGEPIGGSYKRNIESAEGNSLFRIFIWKDLLSDIVREKLVLGFDFGKPFRSKNIEILGIGLGEWSRDGWIGAHNSYLEIIYRSGVIGIIFIFVLFMILFLMIKQAVYLRSLNGILLCSILIFWLTVANFMLILELPFNCIPFWFLFGMTFSYLFKKPVSYTKF